MLLILAGCTTIDGQTYLLGTTTAGPYVMDVAFDDEGNLLVTKSSIVLATFGGAQEIKSTKSFTTTIVKVPRK